MEKFSLQVLQKCLGVYMMHKEHDCMMPLVSKQFIDIIKIFQGLFSYLRSYSIESGDARYFPFLILDVFILISKDQ